MMGFEHFSRALRLDWKVVMWVRRERARRAGSVGVGGGGRWGLRCVGGAGWLGVGC